MAKNFPQWNGPYTMIEAQPQTSNYTLDMAGHDSIYPTYYASELKSNISNNPDLFPNRDHPHPEPVLTADSLEEHKIESIIDLRKHG